MNESDIFDVNVSPLYPKDDDSVNNNGSQKVKQINLSQSKSINTISFQKGKNLSEFDGMNLIPKLYPQIFDDSINVNNINDSTHSYVKPFESFEKTNIYVEYNKDPRIKEAISSVYPLVSNAVKNPRLNLLLWEFSPKESKREYIYNDSLGSFNYDQKFKQNFRSSYHDHIDHILLSNPDILSIKILGKKFGIRKDHRAFIWQMLLKYIDVNTQRRRDILEKKRIHYYKLLESKLNVTMSNRDLTNLNVILLDSTRTRTKDVNIFSLDIVRFSFERILFLWSSMNLSIGYFQGLNEITSILLSVFIESALSGIENFQSLFDESNNMLDLSIVQEALILVEPDVYYCLDKIMSYIFKYYPPYRSGIFTNKMSEIVQNLLKKKDEQLWNHISSQDLTFNQIMFRWLLCLYVREFSTSTVISLWDSYILEGEEGFAHQHVYFTVSFLLYNSKMLLNIKDKHVLMATLIKMPTSDYTEDDIHKIVMLSYNLKKEFNIQTLFNCT